MNTENISSRIKETDCSSQGISQLPKKDLHI